MLLDFGAAFMFRGANVSVTGDELSPLEREKHQTLPGEDVQRIEVPTPARPRPAYYQSAYPKPAYHRPTYPTP